MSIKTELVVAIALITVVITVLPKSPFRYFIEDFGVDGLVNLHYVNWFIPFGSIIAIMEAWLACVAIYYAYAYVMRFIKLIQ